MLPVPGGTFQMGGASGDPDEQPAHTVSIRGFYLGETEVTWALFHAVEKDAHPTPCEDCPARMSFTEAQAFITTLNTITGETYYIPTEAEWEYAAGGGKNNRTTWAGTSQAAELEHFAWLDGAIPHPVKQKQPNPLGLYDMSGNVWEWCQDWHGSYPSDPQTNPQGAKTGYSVVYRGGATNSDAASSRVANRSSRDPNDKGTNIGLRLARYSD
jgi:formylglycine-generating enzyme required for sulfatase activity